MSLWEMVDDVDMGIEKKGGEFEEMMCGLKRGKSNIGREEDVGECEIKEMKKGGVDW